MDKLGNQLGRSLHQNLCPLIRFNQSFYWGLIFPQGSPQGNARTTFVEHWYTALNGRQHNYQANNHVQTTLRAYLARADLANKV